MGYVNFLTFPIPGTGCESEGGRTQQRLRKETEKP